MLSYDSANLLEGTLALIERGEEPYAKAPCGSEGLQGFQVSAHSACHLACQQPCVHASFGTLSAAGHVAHHSLRMVCTNCYPQIAVALMHRFQLQSPAGAAETAAAFARSLHSAWGVGQAACDNGVLLLLSTRDRQVYVSTGKGAEAAGLSREAIGEVLDNMKPALREKSYDAGLIEAVHELGLVLAGSPVPASGDSEGWGIFAFFAAIVASMFGWSWWSNRRRVKRFQVRGPRCLCTTWCAADWPSLILWLAVASLRRWHFIQHWRPDGPPFCHLQRTADMPRQAEETAA